MLGIGNIPRGAMAADPPRSSSMRRSPFTPMGHSHPQMRSRDPFVRHQGSRSLGRSNVGLSPRFADFPSLCACSESSLTNLIGSGLNLLCLQSHSNWNVVGAGQRSRFLVLTKRSAASGDENDLRPSIIYSVPCDQMVQKAF